VAHPQNPSPTRKSQDDSARTAPRRCLLKGCDRYFPPNHPLDRYCCSECQQAARRWSIAKANLNYRASENGKQKRREQSARYRSKCKERQTDCRPQHEPAHPEPAGQEPAGPSASPPAAPTEGYHKSQSHEKSCCQRPGCYERFTPAPRSPLQTFCCPSCRKALRAVLIRERRWFAKLINALIRTRDGPLSEPCKATFV
jgi:hypothetical protein